MITPRWSLCLRRFFNSASILDEVTRNPESFKQNLKMRKTKIDIDRILDLARTDPSSEEVLKLLKALPNSTHEAVANATSPIELEVFGERSKIKKRMVESARSHGVLLRGQAYTVICGDRTYFLTGDLARLERALVRFTVDRLKRHNFKIISVPDLLHADQIEACGMQPRGQRSQVYRVKLNKERELCLSGTAEIALANILKDRSLGRFTSNSEEIKRDIDRYCLAF